MSTQRPPHQQRVVDEHKDLSEKLGKLVSFFQSPVFFGLAEAEQSRLRNQSRFMHGYAAVLEERIVAFTTVSKALTDADALADLAGTPRPDWSAA